MPPADGTFPASPPSCAVPAGFRTGRTRTGPVPTVKNRLQEAPRTVSRTFIDRCIVDHSDGTLDAVHASTAKWWATELQKRVADRCLQLHRDYGYMTEYPVTEAFTDGRIQTIYGGTTEIMKEIIGRSLPA